MTEIRTQIKEGERAPDFTLPGIITKPEVQTMQVSLGDYRGKKNVVLAFHPLAWTPT